MANNCLKFLPYGYNNNYVHLPEKASFCVKEGNKKIRYSTDSLGGRILSIKKASNTVQIIGDSQALGLDVDKIEDHFLSKIYNNSNFKIYAAPNNGPYEVLNFLNNFQPSQLQMQRGHKMRILFLNILQFLLRLFLSYQLSFLIPF